MANTVRGRVLNALSPAGAERYARSLGFPSVAALSTAFDLAARMSEGGELTRADVAALAQHYPTVPRTTLAHYAARINDSEPGAARRDALIRQFGFGTEMYAAQEVVEAHRGFQIAEGVERKRAQHDGHDDRSAATTGRNIADHPIARANQDAAERKMTVAHLMGVNDPPPPRTWREAKDNVADRLEANADRGHALRNLEVNRGRETTRKEDLELAYDGNQAMDEAVELIDADDVANVFEEQQVSPDTPA